MNPNQQQSNEKNGPDVRADSDTNRQGQQGQDKNKQPNETDHFAPGNKGGDEDEKNMPGRNKGV